MEWSHEPSGHRAGQRPAHADVVPRLSSRAPLRTFQKVGDAVLSLDQRGSVMWSRLSHFAIDFVLAEDGPTAVEYAVMLALIIVVCLAAITTLGQNANATFTAVGTGIGSASS
jgi:pilus assembly protein Flp/PilA